MTSFIKNQILKHLTKYAKNLSPEKIKINAFKGEGDVFNLELDEEKLTELLELPQWLKIKRAACNKVSIKVQWTLIKKQPIVLVLDDVIISVEALEIPRKANKFKELASQSQNAYGFIDRVIDGMMIKINMVRIFFTAKVFKASMELTRVSLSSKMPNWCPADHLRKTRIKSTSQGVVLLFKEIEWDSTRIEASALQDCQATPVKLITNATKVRLTIKKSLTDQSIIESKAEFILIDLFWVLTISQIKAAILFTESLKEIIQQSNEINKEAARSRFEMSAKNQQGKTDLSVIEDSKNWSFTNSLNNRQKLFLKYNLKETSYHILVSRVEFHFCEEGEPSISLTKNSVVNGSVKFLLTNSQIDLYPYHVASMTREHFPNYKELHRMRNIWVTNIYSGKAPLTFDDKNRLMESVTLVRFNDISMHCVSTAQKTNNCLFISSDIARHKLPEKTTTFFLDITDHYCRTGSFQNLPETTIYCQINPLNMTVDWPTILWLNIFQLNLKNEMRNSPYASSFLGQQDLPNNHKTPAIHIEAIMPRIVLSPDKVVSDQPDRPQQIQIQIGTFSIDNVYQRNAANGDSVQKVAQEYQKSNFYCGHVNFLQNFSDPKISNSHKKDSDTGPNLNKLVERSVWQICFDPLWIDYVGAKSYNNKPKQFVESLHITMWVTIPSESNSDISIICKFRDRLEIRIDHYQLLLLYRIIDSFSLAMSLMQKDKTLYPKTIIKQESSGGSVTVIFQIDKSSLRLEWPGSAIIANSLTESSTHLQSNIVNNFEENSSDTSETQQKNSKSLFDLEPLFNQTCQLTQDRNKIQNTLIRSRQVSPTNIILNGSPILQPNRRSYTSLMTINKSISNGKSIQSSTTNLLTYKSVKNLFSTGKVSRKGSQTSLNNSDIDKMSIDSDTSDWISDGLLNDLEIGENPLNDDSINEICVEPDGLLESNYSDHSQPCWVNIDISDFKWMIGMGDTTWINFGIFGNIAITESQQAESTSKSRLESVNSEEINTAKVLGKIEYPNNSALSNQSPVTIDIRITKEMDQSLLMSNLVSIGEIFEDEIAPSEKYSETVLAPIIRIYFLASFSLEMIEDRSCNNLSCPSEHSPTLVKIPPGMIMNIEGVTIVSFEFNQPNNEKVLNGPSLCQRCNHRITSLTNHNFVPNSVVVNHMINPYEHIRHERNSPKNKEFNSTHLKMICQLQQQNKNYQNEILRLRSEIQNMKRNQKELRNLIESPSTHFI